MSKLCSAKGQTCHKCKKLNHYARVCRSNNADRQRSTHNQTWPSARQSNPTTKQKIQLVKPENETVSSESSTSEDEYLYTPVTPTHCKKWHSTKHGLDPWTWPKIGPKIGLKILAQKSIIFSEGNNPQNIVLWFNLYRQKTSRSITFPWPTLLFVFQNSIFYFLNVI
jgi:hypothetical protein